MTVIQGFTLTILSQKALLKLIKLIALRFFIIFANPQEQNKTHKT